MLSKFHVPRRSWRRTSPTSARRRVGDPEGIVSHPQGLSEMERARPEGPCQIIDTRQGAISSVQFLSDGNHVIVGGSDGTVRQWELQEGSHHAKAVGKLVHSGREMKAAIVSKDGKWIVLAETSGRTVTIWDLTMCQRMVESIEAHEEITALDVSPDASKIAIGSQDGVVFVWSMESGQCIAGPLKQGRSVLSVRFSPTGDRLASSGPDFSIHVWKICSDVSLSLTCVPTNPAYSLAWSSDGRCLFAGCNQGLIQSFDVSDHFPTIKNWPSRPHFDSVSTLCLSNNGKFVISASSSECSVKIWDALTQSEIHSLKHTSEVLSVEISPDDGHLVSGAKDGNIYIWNLRRLLPISYFVHSFTACLNPSLRSGCPILKEITNAAYVSWKKAELVKAEEILSSEIERRSSHLHYHRANRALVRARLQRWDEALEDAEESFRIKPSLIARLAKSVALSSQKRCNAAIEALDHAFENCHGEEKDFINLIKAIILFDARYRDEAIRLVNNIILRSPDARQPCAFVLAKMYALLATDALNSQQYVKAISFYVQAQDQCPAGQCPELDTLSLISGWGFDGLKLTIYRQSCEACYVAGRGQDILAIVQKMEDIFKDEINLRSELSGWLIDFKSRCATTFESQGDAAMRGKDYDSAVIEYTAALAMTPAEQQETLFVKRSEARIALCLWEDALKDADEAIKKNSSSPWGHERRHAALHKLERYGDAIDALKTMISILENSSDPDIRQSRSKYTDPSDTKIAILDVFRVSAHNSPFRLIDTTSGRLCDAEKRRAIFTEDPIFQELISSMATQLDPERIHAVTGRYFQYVMLSHRWEAMELKLPDVSDKSIYELDASPSATKLQRFCQLARDADFRWAWSDTCCIDKDRDVEFAKSINSMFHWYRRSAATFVYLTGVPPHLIPGALKGSVWMMRGWTLQELLAPPIIRFYYEDWTPYLDNTSLNHKESPVIMQELEDATGVAKHDLLTFRPGPENIRVKLRLASTRETTVPVDMAYGLFGIFGVTMPIIHGESQQHALGRLFQEIVARSGDVACIAWVGQSSEFNSAFPDHIRVYEHQPLMIPHIGEEEMETQVIDLRHAWTREDEAQAVAFYWRMQMLSLARCANQHLHLPCIMFPLTMLKKVKRMDGVRIYRASANVLEDTDINTEERLLSKIQAPGDLILVCPWIHELLDATPICHASRSSSQEGESTSDSASESEPETEHDASADSHYRNLTSGLDPDSSDPLLPLDLSMDQRDVVLRALKLVVRLRQPLGALLLLAQGHGQYKRVATDHDIIIHLRDDVSLDNLVLQTLDVV